MTERALMICPWFGPLPAWHESYLERVPLTGCDFLFDHDLAAFRERVRDILGVECPITEGSAKIHDYRPTLGKLYADELAGYDWFGHTDFDCAYGRIGEFVTDELLAGCDIQTDNVHEYISGPWTLYRNRLDIASLFELEPDWKGRLDSSHVSGWIEQSFSDIAFDALRVSREFFHDYRDPSLLSQDGDRLIYAGREISFFHFRYSKEWPL